MLNQFFGFFTRVFYRTRYFTLLAVAAGLLALFMYAPFVEGPRIPTFAIATATVWICVATPLQWRRIFFDRPFMFYKSMPAPFALALIPILAIWLAIGAAPILLVSLFTFPVSISDGKVVFDYSSPEFRWAAAILCGLIIGGAAAARFFSGKKIKAARFSFLVLPLVCATAYSTLIYKASQIGDPPLFQAPSAEIVVAILNGVFGETLVEEQRKKLSAEQAALALSRSTTDKFRADICKRASRPFKCESNGWNEDCGFRPYTEDDKATFSTIFGEVKGCDKADRAVADAAKLVVEDSIVLWRAACAAAATGFEPFTSFDDIRQKSREVWSGLSCGDAIGKKYCERYREEHGEAHPWNGCPEPSNQIAAETSDSATKREEVKLTARNALYLYSQIDAFIEDRINELIDRVAILGPAEAFRISTGVAVTEVCQKDANRFSDWCENKNPLRPILHILLSPNMLQGFVIATYITLLLMVFRRRDMGDPDAASGLAIQNALVETLHPAGRS